MGVNKAERIGRKAVKAANGIINLTVLTIIIFLVSFASYAMWDSSQVYNAADAAQYEIYKPRAEDGENPSGSCRRSTPRCAPGSPSTGPTSIIR